MTQLRKAAMTCGRLPPYELGIFTKSHVTHPGQPILDGPMLSGEGEKTRGISTDWRQTRDATSGFLSNLTSLFKGRLALQTKHLLQARPLQKVIHLQARA